MRRLAVFAIYLAFATVAFAQVNAIQSRKALMRDNAGQVKIARELVNGERKFDLAVAKKVITTFRDNAPKIAGLFPDGSNVGETKAKPAVWAQKAQFATAAKKLGDDATAAYPGVVDLESFRKAVGNVGKACAECHTVFRDNKK